MKIKICGMKYPENIQEIAALQPDYLGFIFYDQIETICILMKTKKQFSMILFLKDDFAYSER
jgi:phosphoribosylanthranilate isomerase